MLSEQAYKKKIYKKADNVKTKDDLDKLLNEVAKDKTLDYGKAVYGISACMIAVLNYINRQAYGITGFQASCIGWEMVRKLLTDSKVGIVLLDFENMLYPQYEERFSKTIDKEMWEELQKIAKRNLRKHIGACQEVIDHWKAIAKGTIPFGYELEKGENDEQHN